MAEWAAEVLNDRVEAEPFALPKEMQARFLRIAELLERFGPQHVGLPHVRPLGEKLWEMRLGGRDGRPRHLRGDGRPPAGCAACVREENAKDATPRDRFGAKTLKGDGQVSRHLQAIKKKMLADREVRAAYDALAEEFDLARELIAARARAGLTQAEVAERMGTTQSVVARLESGAQMPSVNTLLKFARATHSRPIIKLLAA